MLAVGLMAYVLREITADALWPRVEKCLKVSFWGLNIGLAMMVVLSLLPRGLLQLWDVLQNGYWHARSLAYTGSRALAHPGMDAHARRPGVHLRRRAAAFVGIVAGVPRPVAPAARVAVRKNENGPRRYVLGFYPGCT